MRKRDENGTKKVAKGSQRNEKVSQNGAKERPREPKGSCIGAKGRQRETKGSQKGSQRVTKIDPKIGLGARVDFGSENGERIRPILGHFWFIFGPTWR